MGFVYPLSGFSECCSRSGSGPNTDKTAQANHKTKKAAAKVFSRPPPIDYTHFLNTVEPWLNQGLLWFEQQTLRKFQASTTALLAYTSVSCLPRVA